MTKIATKKLSLEFKIENMILEVAKLFNDVTYSDLQGIASVKAHDIIKAVREADEPQTFIEVLEAHKAFAAKHNIR